MSAWINLPTDFEDAEYEGLRKYRQIQNADNTVSFEDMTEYENYENSIYQAEDYNATNRAINQIMAAIGDLAEVDISSCQGRLTYTSGQAIPDIDITTAENIYFTPYLGHKLSLYHNGHWVTVLFSEISLSLSSLQSGTPYDVFVHLDENDELTLSAFGWGNVLIRPSNLLGYQDGVLVLNSNHEKRYLGTMVLNSNGNGEDSKKNRLLWNYYNRVSRIILSKLVTTKTQGTNHINSWSPYYDEDAPQVQLLIPFSECQFELSGVGLSSGISENDAGYLRAAAIGIIQDCVMTSPYTGNKNIVPAFIHTCGRSPLVVELINYDTSLLGFHSYTLGFWTNYSYYPIGTSLSSSMGECPALYGYIMG